MDQTFPVQVLLRFIFGGTAVVMSTLIARAFGGRIGGVFAAFPAVYLAAIISMRLEYFGDELLVISQHISRGALIGMAADIICAYAASRLIIHQGWKIGLVHALIIWAVMSAALYFSWQSLF